jgi:multiple sugar transport system ATP-binding protein
MAQVTITDLYKKYGDSEVIHGVNIDIADGEFVVLVGPSGCGKSTLLRMVAGLEAVTAGTIRIGDRVVNNLPPAERDIALVFQNYALYPHKTVKANMAFSLRMRRMDKTEISARVDNAAKILGLEPYLDRYPRSLSGGSANGWPWGAPLCATRRCSCSMNHCQILMPNCACRCVAKSANCISG